MSALLTGLIATTALEAASSILSGYSAYKKSRAEARELALANKRLEFEQQNEDRLYSAKKTNLIGDLINETGANGIKFNGSALNALNNSLTEMSMEQNLSRFNRRMQITDNTRKGRRLKREGTSALIGGFMNAGISVLGAYVTNSVFKELDAEKALKLVGK